MAAGDISLCVYLEKESDLTYKAPKDFEDCEIDNMAGKFLDALAARFRSVYEYFGIRSAKSGNEKLNPLKSSSHYASE